MRLGADFRKPDIATDFLKYGALKTPIDWYVKALQLVRKQLGSPLVDAIVVSDGTNLELAPILQQKNVTRFVSHHALADLFALSKAKHIIGAGGSSFTAWGAFLSQADVLSIEGQSLDWFGLKDATTGAVRTLSYDGERLID